VDHSVEDGIAREADDIMANPKPTNRATQAALSKLLIKAAQTKTTKTYVAGEDGVAVTLEAYIQRCIAEVGR
jgi:hypothetical protein